MVIGVLCSYGEPILRFGDSNPGLAGGKETAARKGAEVNA
jgi:hypothetical protein